MLNLSKYKSVLWLMALFCLLSACPSCPSSSQKMTTRQIRIQQINAEIEELKEMKRGFEGRALRAEDQAERMQFEDLYGIETRQYYRLAEEYREKASKVQEQIDKLEAEKARLER